MLVEETEEKQIVTISVCPSTGFSFLCESVDSSAAPRSLESKEVQGGDNRACILRTSLALSQDNPGLSWEKSANVRFSVSQVSVLRVRIAVPAHGRGLQGAEAT